MYFNTNLQISQESSCPVRMDINYCGNTFGKLFFRFVGNEYLLITAKRGWPQLKKLWETPSEELYQKWRKVIKQYEHRK